MSSVLLGLLAGLVPLGQQDTIGTTRVAVVDVPAVSGRYKRTADLEAQFEQDRAAFGKQRDEMRQQIETTGRALQEQFKPGTREFQERRKQLAMMEAELQWFVESEAERIERSLAGSLRSIYRDIEAAVRDVAEERKVEVVLAIDKLPPEPPATTAQARQQIVLQKVIYWHPKVDLTDAVVARVNSTYQASLLAPQPGDAKPSQPAGG